MTTTDPGPDPLANVRKGDRRNVLLTLGDGDLCTELSPRGYYCARREHPDEWQHIAANRTRIAETWGGHTDD